MKLSARHLLHLAALVALLGCASTSFGQWVQPTREELSMTSQAEVPGAPAVYLFREEITTDKLHNWTRYARIKILTERGKEYANVELHQYSAENGSGYTVSDIQGRTIHADGTVIPFTGKPFQKLVEKGQGFKEQAKVFTLPDVQVGSIIEYRYTLRYDDQWYIAPSWFVQTDLFTRKAHFLWHPTDEQLISKNERGEQLTSTVAWTPILPKGAEVKQTRLPGTSMADGAATIELNVQNIAPLPDEEYMPPIASQTYRVLFYYSPYRTVEEYWKSEGKGWSKSRDKFIGPDNKIRDAVKGILTPAETTDEAKLRKLYAAVMQLENTRFTRQHSAAEEKAQGLGAPKAVADIWERKRGTDDQITELFVSMARAAGMKAYVMVLTSRDRDIFNPSYLSFNQLQDEIAIVTVGGKEQYFDPGQRFCAYGHLAWKHSMASGIRQTDSGSAFAEAPGEPYSASRAQRIADLVMDEHGDVSGGVKMTWTGAPALTWRQHALEGDSTSLDRDLRTSLEHLLPGGMDVKLAKIENLEDYEKPLIASFEVKGPIGSPTGKRLIVPGDIFEANAKPSFPHEKRELPIYFQYPHIQQDAFRLKFPATFTVESAPTAVKIPFQQFAAYSLAVDSAANSVTVRRDFSLGNCFYKSEEYPGLRAFYNKMETTDQESTVLKVAALPAAGN